MLKVDGGGGGGGRGGFRRGWIPFWRRGRRWKRRGSRHGAGSSKRAHIHKRPRGNSKTILKASEEAVIRHKTIPNAEDSQTISNIC